MEYPVVLKVGRRSFKVEYETVLKGTSSIRIRNKTVVLKLSRFVHGRKCDEIVEKFLKWAGKKLKRVSESDFVMPDYKDGGRICTHNKVYGISVNFEDRKNVGTVLEDGIIRISFPKGLPGSVQKEKIKVLVEKIIIKDQNDYLREVIDELNQLYFQEKYSVCRFKRTNSRFGSCSSKRNINIAYKLLFAPRKIFRYVCVHELAHLRQMNHSKRFWSLVAGAEEDYKECEKWLRDNGFMLG